MPINGENYQRIVRAKLFIDEHFPGPIDLEQVSRRALLSLYHFHRLFRQVYQRTPHQYITQKRMERACDLLASNRPVAEVCREVGFESTSSFSILFKKKIGFAPQYYRNMAWKKKQEQLLQPRKAIPQCFIEKLKLDQ